jgi:transcriptional/translational regulatory protein YebC/TACO1
MSGHSKWSSIKHKKGAADAKRGQLFTKLTRALIVAAKEGGADPAANLALQNAIEDEATAMMVLKLIDALEENDDVQDVYANFDIPERVLEAVAG